MSERKTKTLRPLGEFLDVVLFILGFRKSYSLEVFLSLFAFVVFSLTVVLFPDHIILHIATSILFLAPLLAQYLKYLRSLRYLPEPERKHVPRPAVPLITVLLSAMAAGLSIYALPVSLLNTLFIEDLTIFLDKVDIISFSFRRGIHIMFEPVRRRELLATIVLIFVCSLVSFVVTGNVLVFIYPVVAYAIVVYSVIYVPPDIRTEVEERRASVADELARRIPLLYLLFRAYYLKPSAIRTAKEAGFIGASYYEFVRRAAGMFAFITYTSLAVTPLLYAFLSQYGYGAYAALVPLVSSAASFYLPSLYVRLKRASRTNKISRNMLLIMSYLSSTYSVSETFTNAMEYLMYTPTLSRMFGMEDESRIYINIYKVVGDESRAMEEYANTIPDELYRDTIRSIKDIADNEGYGAVFNTLVSRLIDYTSRYIDRTKTMFENIGGNIISVSVLAQTALPILFFLANPMMMPLMMIAGGLLLSVFIFIIARSVLPDMPSDFIYAKQRLRGAAVLFSVATGVLTIVQYILLPEYVSYLIVMNCMAGLLLAVWYAYKEDFDVNNMFLSKFPDLLILFSSSMSRTNAIDRTLYELAGQSAFPERMRAEFKRLAGVYAVTNVERITYRGPFWFKYFLFLTGISARYGTTPRELYKAISEFMLEYKKFFAHVSMFSKSLLILTIMSLAVMTIEIQIVADFLILFSKTGVGEAVQQFDTQFPIPVLTPEEVQTMKTIGYMSILFIALVNGLAIGKVSTGSFRSPIYGFILYIIALSLIVISTYTGFGLRLSLPQG